MSTPQEQHSIHTNSQPINDEQQSTVPVIIRGYKIVGDNVDKSINPRYYRTDQLKTDCHYYHLYAVKNRIDFTHLSDQQPHHVPITAARETDKFLPSTSDDEALQTTFKIYVARVLITHCAFFETSFSDLSVHHIPHIYSQEMSNKSNVVRLNAHMYNITLYVCRYH